MKEMNERVLTNTVFHRVKPNRSFLIARCELPQTRSIAMLSHAGTLWAIPIKDGCCRSHFRYV